MWEECSRSSTGVDDMTAQVRTLLDSFDLLPDPDKQELAAEIIRRSLMFSTPPLTDEQLVGAAEEIFVALDRSEEGHA
jgi:hypothetical protein